MIIVYILILLLTFNLLSMITDDYFVFSLEKIAEKFNISSDVAGSTLMALGTSAPELFIALIAVSIPGGHHDIGIGTIVGSALFNLLVIIGVTSYISDKKLSWRPIMRDLFFYLLSIATLFYTLQDGRVTLFDAVLLIVLYAGYVFVVMKWKKWFPRHIHDEKEIEQLENEEDEDLNLWQRFNHYLNYIFYYIVKKTFPAKDGNKMWIIFTFSIVWISVLSWVLVECAIRVADILAVPEAVVALTVLAAGTSVPDLLASRIVALKGKGNMAIANSVGSNIFDILVGLGLPWLIVILYYGNEMTLSVQNLHFSLLLLMASVVFVYLLFVLFKWKTNKFIGVTLIGLYTLYIVWEIANLYI